MKNGLYSRKPRKIPANNVDIVESVNDSMKQDPQTYAIIGAGMEVHNCMGSGFLEKVYHEALKVEFAKRNIPFSSEVLLPVVYKGINLDCHYQPDFICFNSIIVELKSIERITVIEEAQLINYLRVSNMKKGLLLNFGSSRLELIRRVN